MSQLPTPLLDASQRWQSRFAPGSMARRLMLIVILMSVLPLGGSLAYTARETSDSLRGEVISKLTSLADARANQIETYFLERQRAATSLSRQPQVADALEAYVAALKQGSITDPSWRRVDSTYRTQFVRMVETNSFADMFLISPEGQLVFSLGKGEDLGSNLFSGPWRDSELARVFDRAKTLLNVEISNFGYYSVTNQPAAFIAVPIFQERVMVGVIALQVNNTSFFQVVSDYTGLGRSGETVVASLLNNQAVFLAPLRHEPLAAFRRSVTLGSTGDQALQDAVRGITSAGLTTDYRGQSVVAAWRYLPTLGAGMVVKMDAEEALAPIYHQRNAIILIGALVLILVLVLAVVISRNISRPLSELTAVAQLVAQGDLGHTVPVRGNDEIGRLAVTFNTMVDDLRRMYQTIEEKVVARTTDLHRSEQRLRRLLESSPVGISITSAENDSLLFANSSFRRMFGLLPGFDNTSYDGRQFYCNIADHDHMASLLRLNGRVDDFQVKRRRVDGREWWSLTHARTTEFAEQDAFIQWHYDITQRVIGEIALSEAKAAAEQALSELRTTQENLIRAEKMASLSQLVAGIAHEINTPIGTALTAATALETRTGEFVGKLEGGQVTRGDLRRYSDVAREGTSLVVSNINRAAELIHSFKQVAVDQTSGNRRSFMIGDYLHEVLHSLTPRLKKTKQKVSVLCPDDRTMDSYPGALSQVVTNLVLNSLLHAFTPEEEGDIVLTVTYPDANTVDIAHQDSGKGISAANLPRIFDPFFTTRRGSGGTGLGLHIVYNIVTTTLGGAISVNSEEGKGTTFVMRLPLSAPRPAPVSPSEDPS